MRALTHAERLALLSIGSGSIITDPDEEVMFDELVSIGRVRWVYEGFDDDGDEVDRAELTDLGRLALRVSVPGAPVPT